MVGTKIDKVYPARFKRLRGQANACPLQFSGQAR